MNVRFSAFTGTREVRKVEGGYTTRVDFELPHNVMLTNLSHKDLVSLYNQCSELLQARGYSDRTIYLGTVDSVEEVHNRLETESESSEAQEVDEDE